MEISFKGIGNMFIIINFAILSSQKTFDLNHMENENINSLAENN